MWSRLPFDQLVKVQLDNDANNELVIRTNVKSVFIIGTSLAGTLLFLNHLRRIAQSSDRPFHKRIQSYCFSWLRCLPSFGRAIEQKLAETEKFLKESIHESDQNVDFIQHLPELPMANLADLIDQYNGLGGKFDFSKGRISGTVYTDEDPDHLELLQNTFALFAYSNPLHPDVFPAVRKMEAEIVRILCNLFNGDQNSCGTVTSGGTESLILACLSSREYARSRGITEPVVVIPETAHVGLDKACSYLGIRIKHVQCDPTTKRVNLRSMKRAIDGNTCLLVGSAPNFPYGSVDDIPAIAQLGLQYSIPVHVDACLGGFLVAFAADTPALAHIPVFDFRIPGVTSISCDTHKYGYAPKGTSVILYRSPELLHHQYYCAAEWSGGIYATPTLSGSRSGLNIALTWATLLYFGRSKYSRRAHLIATKTAQLADAIAKIPGLCIIGSPDVSVVAFTSHDFNIHAVGDRLGKAGWNLNALQYPNALHFCITYNQVKEGVILEFLLDLQRACEEVADLEDRGNNSQTAVLYGMAAQIPDKSVVTEIAHLYLDACYSQPEHK